jgi:hypothetical protein
VTKLLITLHVLSVILLIGPIAVAVSLFPRYAKLAAAGDTGAAGIAALLHRISRVYAIAALAVPVLGFAAAGALKVTDNQWVIESTILTVVAALVLALLILPAQRRALAPVVAGTTDAGGTPVADQLAGRLAAFGGVFNLLWLVITVLMVYRPGFHRG